MREGQGAVLRVRDNGIGISPEMQRRIFDLFVQADLSLDRAQGGLGIGLTLVRSLVELHGGTIAVQSAGPGQGSEFVVRLPLSAETTTLEQPHRDPVAIATGDQLRILLVDDRPDCIETMAKLLELRGHQVRCTSDGATAVELADASRVDVVLLDIGLPGMNGYQVAEQLRRRWSPDQLTLIAVSGYGGEEVRRRSSRAGFDHHLVKPVSLGDLERILESHPRGRTAEGRGLTPETALFEGAPTGPPPGTRRAGRRPRR
jgi:CheY-like chemotaxis protein